MLPKDNGAASVSRGMTPIVLNQLIVADTVGVSRLSLLHKLVGCFQSNFEKHADFSITDYSCHNYAGNCFFQWSLLI